MTEIDIGAWVEQSTEDREKTFRAAVHTVLHAIANSPLRSHMIIKGGILMAVLHQSLRHTRDIDFSTTSTFSGFDLDSFENTLDTALTQAVEFFDYGLDCRIQKLKIEPRKEKVTFPTLVVTIGYAPKYEPRKHKRLLSKNSSDIVKVEYSFNEITREIVPIQLADSGEILAYSLADLIAEKYRAILQQEVRNRVRRQDALDFFSVPKV